jgi:hypothetical protein
VDSARPDDSGDGLSWATAKKTLQAAANLTGPAVVNVKNNGWTNPYPLTASVSTKSNGTSGSHWQWNFNAAGSGITHGAVVTTMASLSVSWTLVPGTSYVYRTAMASNPIRIFSMEGDDGWLVENLLPREWLKRASQPNDSNDHQFWFDATNQLLYICDHSGDPGASGVSLFYLPTLIICFNIGHDYHDVLGGMFFATDYTFGINSPHTKIDGCSMWYPVDSHFTLWTGSGGCTIQNCLSIVSPINGCFHGHARGMDTVSGCNFSQNTFYAGALGLQLTSNPSTNKYIVRNNIFVDISSAVYTPSSLSYFDIDYNAYGITDLDVAACVYGFPVGQLGSHDVYTDNGSGGSTLALQFQNPLDFDFSLLAASPCIDKGTDLGVVTDYRSKSRPWGKAPDIGAYEMRLSQHFF